MRKETTVTMAPVPIKDKDGKETGQVLRDRDTGKVFQLTEMPASQVEDWAFRAFLALAKNGIDVPDDVTESGLAGLASFGLKGLVGLPFSDAKPLLDEMMDCVRICPDPKHPNVVRDLVEDDIEELATRIKLRAEIFKLHVNFSTPGVDSTTAGSKTIPGAGFRTTRMSQGR